MQPLQKEYIKLYTKSLGNLNYLLPMQLRQGTKTKLLEYLQNVIRITSKMKLLLFIRKITEA